MEERTKITQEDYAQAEHRTNGLGFHVFCQKLEKALRKREPLERVRDFFDHALASSLQPGSASLYPILKLMFPGEVIRTYNMQAVSLAKMYITLIPLPSSGKDGKRLLHYRDPELNAAPFTGDFGKTLEDVLGDRISSMPSTWTLGKVDHFMTQLSQSNAEEKRKLFKHVFLHNLCPMEHKFLVRIMLDELRLGFSVYTFLKIFNDKGVIQRYNMSQNLRGICAELALHHKVDVPRLELLQCFQVQLSERVSSLENALTRMKGASFVMDQKVDGERYVVHKEGFSIKLFSRTCREPSAGYYQKLQPALLQQIQVEECILDGEVVVWDETLGRHAQFGTNRSAAAAAAVIGNNTTLMFIAFDVVYVGGETGQAILKQMGWKGGAEIHTMPLEQRRLVLKRVLIPRPHVVEVVEHVVVDHSLGAEVRLERVTQYFKEAIEKKWEGLVLKSMNETYLFGSESRSRGMSYGQQGYYAEYLVGLKDDLDEDEDGDMAAQRYIPIAKVSTGLTDGERKELHEQLDRGSIPGGGGGKVQNKLPSWVVDWKAKKADLPDKWIQPSMSYILEIECSEIIKESRRYPLDVALRFPRIVRVRHDKSIQDITRKGEFLEMQRQGITVDDLKRAKRAKHSHGPRLPMINPSSHGKLSPETLPGNLFHGKIVYVLPGTYNDAVHKTRRDVENLIKRHGGRIVANVLASLHVDYIIGPSIATMQVTSMRKQGKYDILSLGWVLDCIQEGRLLELKLDHVIGATPMTRKSIDMDVWGDSFTQAITNEKLMALLQSIPSSLDSKTLLSPSTLDDVVDDSFGGRVFYVTKDEQDQRAYGDAEVVGLPRRVPLSTLDVSEMLLRVYGGRVSPTLGEHVTTLVIASSSTYPDSHLETVDEEWIASKVGWEGIASTGNSPGLVAAEVTATTWDTSTKGLEIFAHLKTQSTPQNTKLACFDLDNTLIQTKSGATCPVNQDDWQWCSSRIKPLLYQHHRNGYDIVVLTNQAKGAMRGFEHIKQKIEKVCQDADIPILVLMSVGMDSPYRKPKVGFMEYLSFVYNGRISLRDSFYVGDAAGRAGDFSDSDMVFAQKARLNFYNNTDYFRS